PGNRAANPTLRGRHLAGLGEGRPLHPRSTTTGVGRRRFEQPGVRWELADERQLRTMAMTETRHLVAAEPRIADENKAPQRKSSKQDAEQSHHQLGRSAMAPTFRLVDVWRAIQ